MTWQAVGDKDVGEGVTKQPYGDWVVTPSVQVSVCQTLDHMTEAKVAAYYVDPWKKKYTKPFFKNYLFKDIV